ncbi:MAG TPA: arsenate reductase ArsC [Deferrisomatales bacterium]|nr:arsenate reductase ArsC [Deferrisomatales bacterium]
MKRRVLFLCTGNSCRSQMAHGWLDHLAGDRYAVYSAGMETHGVNPRAVQVMAETGVDISHYTCNAVREYLDQSFDLLVTVCGGAKDACPLFAGEVKERQHWPFDDPAGATGSEEEILAVFRRVRDAIRRRIETFLEEDEA